MPISVADLAKQLEIAPEAVVLHAMDLDFEVPDDEMLTDELAEQIKNIELGDEISQFEHEMEEQRDREIVQSQAAKTAGNKKSLRKKEKKEEDRPEVEVKKEEDGTIILPEEMTVREFAVKISKPIPIVLVKLKANGVVANLKETVDYETCAVVAADLDIKVKKEQAELSGEDLFHGNLDELLADEDPADLIERPCVVSVMGHVDHGKTSILDNIRQANVVDGEAGGITQRIGAYQVDVPAVDGEGVKKVTFLDTPGHEAFTRMRARGAQATDIAILVVAATEGLMPQTIEAINHAKAAEIPVIVAINKMDLDGANPDLAKGQLAEHDLTAEDWGGETVCVPVSAKTGEGIDKLLETVLITAEIQALKANPDRKAVATVIESSMDKKSGVTATVLVNTGTMKRGDAYVIGAQHGKVRTMKDHNGEDVKSAAPSTPVQLSGFKELLQTGDILQIMDSEKQARKKAEEVASISHEVDLRNRKKMSIAAIKAKMAEGRLDQLKVVVKADSQGVTEAVVAEVEKVRTETAMAKVVHSGVGEVSESDIMLASAGNTVVVAFNTPVPGRIQKEADRAGVEVLSYDVIYHLTEKIHEILEGKISAQDTEEIIGELMVKGVFAANKKMAVIGGEVTLGKMRKNAHLRQYREIVTEETDEEGNITEKREWQLLGQAKLETVQKEQDVVNEVSQGEECGLRIDHKEMVFEVGDKIQLFIEKK